MLGTWCSDGRGVEVICRLSKCLALTVPLGLMELVVLYGWNVEVVGTRWWAALVDGWCLLLGN